MAMLLVWTLTPRSSSSAATAALAEAPKMPSGFSSGVIRLSSTSSR